MNQGKIEVKNISVRYPNPNPYLALENVHFTVNPDEFVSLMGPSGCGKTTTLQAISGLVKPEAGSIRIDGKPAAYPCPKIQMMFQQPFLFHWKTVEENVGLRFKLGSRNQAAQNTVSETIELVDLDKFRNFYPDQLSVGMQQRASLARALVSNPRIMLMDEPFRAIDYQKRMRLHEFLLDLKEKLDKTILFVTHDIDEAILLSDRILLMTPSPGKIQEEIEIKFPKKRSYHTTATSAFVRYKKKVLDILISQHEEG